MRSFAVQAVALAAGASAHALRARDIASVDANGAVCPAVPTTTVQIQPVFYSEYIPYNIVIDPFRNGHPITVSNAPTVVVTATQLTTTITPVTTPTSSTTGSGVSSTTGTGSVSGTATSSGSTITSTPSGFTTTSALPTTGYFNSSSLTFGAGLPSGSYTDLPTETYVALAIATPGGGFRKRGEQDLVRRIEATATPCVAVNLSPSSVSGGVSQDQCDQSTPLNLIGGKLVQNGRAVAKASGEKFALIGFGNAGFNTVDIVWSLINGVLSWVTDDGTAIFYDCSGSLYAAFDDETHPGCTVVDLGAIAGSACVDHIKGNGGTPNPSFTDPASTASSTTTASAVSTTTPSGVSTTSASGNVTVVTTSVASPTGESTTGGAATTASTEETTSDTTTSSVTMVSPTIISSTTSATNETVTTTTTTTATSILTGATSTATPANTCEDLPSPYHPANATYQYDTSCNTQYVGNTQISTSKQANFRACIDTCAAESTCVSLNYVSDASAGSVYLDCDLFSDLGTLLTGVAEYDTAAQGTMVTRLRMRNLYH